MTIFIGLLRGINVGGHHIIKMADLKVLLEELSLRKVKTYIQSGNVVFESDEEAAQLVQQMEATIASKFGFPVPVVLRTVEEFEQITQACPFPTESLNEGESVHIAFLASEPTPEGVQVFSSYQSETEHCDIRGEDVYLFFQQSFRDSKLAKQLPKLGVPATVRNWKTVMKLAAMAKDVAK